jgi:hypothetical protein
MGENMIELSLEHEAVEALIKILNAQTAPLPWHLIDALHTMQEEYDNEAERQHSARYDWDRTAEND